jgi:hypothetical protein
MSSIHDFQIGLRGDPGVGSGTPYIAQRALDEADGFDR